MTEKKNLKDISSEQLEFVWKRKPDGDLNAMHILLQFEALQSKVPMSEILDKWTAYLDMCQKEERESKYIKKFENYITYYQKLLDKIFDHNPKVRFISLVK